MLRLLSLWDKLRSNFWLVPGTMALLAIGLSVAAAYVDHELGAEFATKLGWVYSGGPAGARSVLSAIASSVMGVAGTTFSITTAVLSLTSGQFGPRLLRSFMRDIGNQVVLGTFTSTFLYCLLVLRTVRGGDENTYVPHISVTLGVLLAVLSVGVLIYFIHHVAESIQVSHLIEEVGQEADEIAQRVFPRRLEPVYGDTNLPAGEPGFVRARSAGYVIAIDEAAVLSLAEREDLVVRIDVRPGDYVLPDMKLMSVWPVATKDTAHQLSAAFRYDRRRSTVQDAEFAFLQLSEVGVRALSPGVNDPFTAMMCIDRITAAMCHVTECDWPAPHHYGNGQTLRVVAEPYPAGALVEAAFGHIRHAAQASPAVLQRLRKNLRLLIERASDTPLRTALQNELAAV